MELIIADHSGFCFGVSKAMKTIENLVEKKQKAYTLGPIIHNPQEVERLKHFGITAADFYDIKDGNVVIRTHGVGPDVIEQLESRGLNIIDCTCPLVKRVHKLAADISNKGYLTIIIGDHNHPEVEGIKSWCNGDVKVIENVEEAKNFYTNKRVGVVVQTTQTEENVENIIDILQSKLDIAVFHNTRCKATLERQTAAAAVAANVDIMLVIGGKNSSNTKKLAQVCQNVGAKVYHIETATELKKDWFKSTDKVGITAGASTPDWIIKEVISKMDELNKDMDNKEIATNEEEGEIIYEDTFADLKEDTIVEGTVVKVDNNEVLVNIGYKSDGIIPINELSNVAFESPEDIIKVGDKIQVYVIKLEDNEGNVILSKKKADAINAWNFIEQAYNSQNGVEGVVTEVVKGGVLANINGIKGFIPASHLDLKYVPDLNVFVGQNLKLQVIELDRKKNRVVLSHKNILEKERERLKEKTWATIKEGQIIKGVVKRLTDFGAFVDIGGVDGLIHISDLTWQKIKHPSEIVTEEQEVEVQVLRVDKERGRISLGLKQIMPNPWDDVDKKYKVGSVIDGKVVKLVSFGAFVEVEPGIEGLVHISQISKDHVSNPEDVLKTGDNVKVKIMDINAKEKRMSLSIKEAQDENENKQIYENTNENNGVTIGEMVGDLFDKK
ncbi:MAG: bifunctional 4-hydroxy-3-methylbut-2-enyl diphosphate reductase/30S ribosomal protein S1 [Thermoanaerobacteraceae bacterium]|nr:bifunctional 4-hydroxy-3-methylbut-2-enyl diphosphate reductase/30S ribosomal protein S1 [Thermoanaerobacteraceae bacterium]